MTLPTETLQTETSQAETSQANPVETGNRRPDEIVAAPDRRRLAPIIVSAIVHALVLAIVLYEQSLSSFDVAPREEEVAVEVVAEPPAPPPQPEAPPEPEPEKEQPKPQEKPPQPKITLDEKPAYDAPRAPNQETVQREAPDQQTKAQRPAPPNDARAAKPSTEAAADPQRQKEASAELAPEQPKADEDKKDAEVLEQARTEPQAQPQDTRGEVEIKASPEPKPKSIAEQLASLEPVPEFKYGGKSKPSPVSGGTADTTYFSILYGLIVPQLHVPPHLRGKRPPNTGLIHFYVDGEGHLTHQAVFRSSGLPELDAAALAAVRRAAPSFPAPPGRHAVGIAYQFTGS